MKKINIIVLGLMSVIASCSTDLDQVPPNIAESDSLTEFSGVLNAAYNYQTGSATPLAVMGDFRADNNVFDESPHNEFNDFDGGLTTMEGTFFKPFYVALYKSILSANNVIENSVDPAEVGEAKFLRGLSYFKLVKVFGDVTINLSAAPDVTDTSILVRRPAAEAYSIIITDLTDAIGALDNSRLGEGRATQIAAQALLGKVYVQKGDFASAKTHLAAVISEAAAEDIELEESYAKMFTKGSDLNKEIIFATQIASSIAIAEYSSTTFPVWYSGGDTKADEDPVNIDLLNAFDAAGDVTRKNAYIDSSNQRCVKYGVGNSADYANADWTEIRLSDIVLLYAEVLNEETNADGSKSATILAGLDGIRTRADLATLSGTASTQADVRTAIANERRLELAFEGHRWFDLVRTGTTGMDAKYDVFPIPTSEIFASGLVITQNTGY
ncbi:RagB/SusD family nutrient uptake outer membrane protein [Polaribacter sp. Hel1_85]|uniref:RagB/SusD family nutrient uptake outer membrane protein n=1 Tax=Polaribacter sp. Hel1_85 TaxID=1250005 RepID=UPI00052C331A|nr:RagB/SusD family nutrient uptake outer membrane protein [Polaribacter sp. Hel1_85]KGL61788.1 SusD/RagB family lipoprotein [Polaribacter sp. Hel1_85]